jgi:hypothetical protein
LNQNIYTPTAGFVTKHYGQYAAPRVAKAQDYVLNEWSDKVQPNIDTGKDWTLQQYNQNLAPHVTNVWKATSPYVTKVQDGSLDFYQNSLVPGYQKTLPHAQKAYYHSYNFLTQVFVPYVQSSYSTVSTTFFKYLWPQMVILYGENVEPQITRITQRLGRYRDSQKLKAVFNADTPVVSVATSSASSIATASTTATTTTLLDNQSTSVVDNQSAPTPASPIEADTRETIESDLKQWMSKFAVAADKGTEDLSHRVTEITDHQIKSQAHSVGHSLVAQLGNTVESSLKDLKSHINNSITKMPSEATETDENVLCDELLQYIRSTGEKIRVKAMAVRSWKQSYDNETDSLVQAALQSTLDVVDNIRDLGLQQMGMRWASLEGVTYKDWSKYHDLKKEFDSHRNAVAATTLAHESLLNAKQEGDQVKGRADKMAEDAAIELKRLKDVVRWKVQARDSTDDFSTKVIPAKAVKAAHSIASAASKSIQDISASASSLVTPEEPSHVPLKVFGGVAASYVQGREVDLDDEDSWSEKIQILLDTVGDKASDLTDAVSSALIKPTSTQGAVESVTSVASQNYYSALSAASNVLYGTPQAATDSIASVASERYSQAVTA